MKLTDNMQMLVEKNQLFAISQANKYKNRGVEIEELRSQALLGMCKASLYFEPSMGFKFTTFAFWYIKKEILKSFEVNKDYSRSKENEKNKSTEIFDFDLSELVQQVKNKVLANRSEIDRQIFNDRLLGLSFDFIADDLKITRQAVAVRFYKTLSLIKKEVQKMEAVR